MPETWLRPGRSERSCTETGTMATRLASGNSPRSSMNCRSTPDTSAITTSLTFTSKWFLTVLMSSKSSWAKPMFRWAVIRELNGVCGAAKGEAIARPPATRRTVSTTVDTVSGRTFVASVMGRVANLPNPPSAILIGFTSALAATGSGAGASGSTEHSCDIRLAPVTPSTAAWWTFVITASRPPLRASVPPSPSMAHISHSGWRRSSGRAARWPQTSASSALPPGAGRPIRCTCRSMSKCSSSTHTGWSRLRKLLASFSRKVGMAVIRRANCSRKRSKL